MGKPATPVLAGYHVKEFMAGYGFEGFEPIPVVALDEPRLVSRHELTDEEVEEIVRTREVFVVHPHDTKRFLPVYVLGARPEYTVDVLVVVGLPVTRMAVCHGLDVTDAGGTEAERQDYAVAEAASLVARAARLPCRVALFNADKEWGDIGGEECAGRAQLEEALTRRLMTALTQGSRQVEARDSAGGVFKVTLAAMTPRQCREGQGVLTPG